eukprot:3200826-Rhodomonas_salina.1
MFNILSLQSLLINKSEVGSTPEFSTEVRGRPHMILPTLRARACLGAYCSKGLRMAGPRVTDLGDCLEQAQIPHTAWRMALAAGKTANHGNVAKMEKIG